LGKSYRARLKIGTSYATRSSETPGHQLRITNLIACIAFMIKVDATDIVTLVKIDVML